MDNIMNNQDKSIKHKYNVTYANEYVDTRSYLTRIKESFKIASIPALIASLCCLSPIILFSLGIVSASVAGELADLFYGKYKWVFRAVGLAALLVAFYYYMKRQNVCTVDDVVKRRNEILNKLAILLIVAILLYIFILYFVLHYIGVLQGIWQ